MITHIIAFIAGGGIGAVTMSLFCAKGVVDLHSELADMEARIDRAIAAMTPRGASIGKKMVKILKGEK